MSRLYKKIKLLMAFVLSLMIALSPMVLNIGAFNLKQTGEQNKNSNTIMPLMAKTSNLVDVEVTVNYYRYGGDYTSWNLWLWADGGDGASVSFTTDNDYGKTFTKALKIDTTLKGVGFIVRKGDWVAKDIDTDRFIPYSAFTDNKVEIFLLEGDETIYYNESDVDKSTKIKSLQFTSVTEVKATMTGGITAEMATEEYTIKANNAPVEIASKSTNEGSKVLTFTLSKAIDFSKAYTLTSASLNENVIGLSNLFGTEEFKNEFHYDGKLGAIYSKQSTEFVVWAPTATSVSVNLFEAGNGGVSYKTESMTKGDNGIYSVTISGDLNKVYYTYSVTANGATRDTVDVYATAVGVNGDRGMVVDLDATNPSGWDSQKSLPRKSYTDTIIYEAHIRDMTIDESSGVSEANRGKFLGLTETGTKNSYGQSTALDHLKELGVTDLHILPSYDFATIDETRLQTPQFNWGYDPKNYNTLEGSYSTDPYNGEVRINEFKQMVMTLHNNDIRVVMDVVYNHTFSTDSWLNRTVPGYYYRTKADGSFSNGSGCGNETASDRSMYQKYMIDSVVHYATEYKIDGFRFDLMGLHDIETMNKIADALHEVNPNIIIYGEGWDAGGSALDPKLAALKKNAKQMPNIAFFNDDVRDGLKGSVFDATSPGYIQGASGNEDRIKFGITGASGHSQVTTSAWAKNPTQTINYMSAHDNNTLYDKIKLSTTGLTEEQVAKINMFGASIMLTAQGIPFFQAGEEFLRSKPLPDGGYDHNSYKSSDAVNSIKWDLKNDNSEVYSYYKNLIALRKMLPELTLDTGSDIFNCIYFSEAPAGVVAYQISFVDENGKKVNTFVVHNQNDTEATIKLPTSKEYSVYIDGTEVSLVPTKTVNGNITVKANSTMLVRAGVTSSTSSGDKKGGCGGQVDLSAGMAILAVALLGGIIRKRKA